MVKYLVEAVVDLSLGNFADGTPLCSSSPGRSQKVVAYLTRAGAKCEKQDKEKWFFICTYVSEKDNYLPTIQYSNPLPRGLG